MTSRLRAVAVVSATLLAVLLAGCGGDAGQAGAAASPASTAPTPSSASASPTTDPSTTTSPSAPSTTPSRARATTRTAAPTTSPTTPAHAKATAPGEPQALAPVPATGPQPTVRFPRNSPAQGRGANAVVAPVPDALWGRMTGYSWSPGCPVGRSGLRQVTVNFWGFDGKRSRGTLVVNQSVASRAAAAFTQLYDLRFRIRQMRPMDSSWGHNPKGPGANDYAAMRADNTSAFNCRYVGGEEASKNWSNHAYGTAIDVNDFENPYVAADGTIYPGPYWAHRRSPAPGVFSSKSSPAVRAFTSQGLRWGGLWAQPDYQHFDAR